MENQTISMYNSENLWQDNLQSVLVKSKNESVCCEGCFEMYLEWVVEGGRGGAKMVTHLLLAYVTLESISFSFLHFLDFCIWDTPICQFSDHTDAKTDIGRKESDLFKIA